MATFLRDRTPAVGNGRSGLKLRCDRISGKWPLRAHLTHLNTLGNRVRNGLAAGGNRIRTIGPAEKETAVERGPAADHRRLARRPVLNDPTHLIGAASLVGNSRETFHQSGTDGSNPVPSSSESANHRFRDDFTGYARDQDAPTVTRYLTSPRPKRADRDTHSLPRERVRSPAHLALAARSGEGPLPIRFADLGHRALKTGGLLNSRPIFRADRTGSWPRMRHLAAHFSGWFVLA